MTQTTAVGTIDMTPTWGEIGIMTFRLMGSGEHKALSELRPELAKAFAAAEALKSIQSSLSDEQKALVSKALVAELGKMGY